jgi:cobyrinic acid a,c-diamide synthase
MLFGRPITSSTEDCALTRDNPKPRRPRHPTAPSIVGSTRSSLIAKGGSNREIDGMNSGMGTIEFPRLALATPATGPEPSVACLAMLAGLTRRRWRVQHFRTRACPTVTEAVGQVTGLPGRHLDSWLMPPALCRGLFARSAQSAELAVVEGTLDEPMSARSYTSCDFPGDLLPIAETLDLPIVAVVSCARQDAESFHLPQLPEGVDAVLLDEVTDPKTIPRLKRLFRMAAKLPVIGAIEIMPQARAALEKVPRDGRLPDGLIDALAHGFWKHADFERITELGRSRPMPELDQDVLPRSLAAGRSRFRVAYANDEAFGRYFPDTIEALEALGADLIEFSPLRDERLPAGVDLAMIGCGMPDLHADVLASNFSMIAALREHVCRGRRIYTEGGGTAYLGRGMVIAGRRVQGAGILPFDAELVPDALPPTPVTRTLLNDCWLGPRGTTVRAYKSSRWKLIPSIEPFECPSCFGALAAEGDWFYRHHAVGSLLHLHLGALPEVVDAFVGPHSPSLRRPSARG